MIMLCGAAIPARAETRVPILPVEVLPVVADSSTVTVSGELGDAAWVRATITYDPDKPEKSAFSLAVAWPPEGGATLLLKTHRWKYRDDGEFEVTGEVLWRPGPGKGPTGTSKDLRGTVRVVSVVDRNAKGNRAVRLAGVLEATLRSKESARPGLRVEFDLLGRYADLGDPPFTETSVGRLILDTYETEGIDAATAALVRAERELTGDYDFSERELELAVRAMLERGDGKSALRLLEQYGRMYPRSSLLQERYGEAYIVYGGRDKARRHLEAALDLDPANTNAVELLRFLRSRR